MPPVAYCESMCVFLLLSGKTRYVPETAHVRVHQIWMGDRANDARAATYSADDLTIVERDIGRLAKYTFDMGGAGDLLLLSLNVPPWEDLHELSPDELRLSNLVNTNMDDQPGSPNAATVELKPKPVQGRFVGSAIATEKYPEPARSINSAEAVRQTGVVRAAASASGQQQRARTLVNLDLLQRKSQLCGPLVGPFFGTRSRAARNQRVPCEPLPEGGHVASFLIDRVPSWLAPSLGLLMPNLSHRKPSVN